MDDCIGLFRIKSKNSLRFTQSEGSFRCLQTFFMHNNGKCYIDISSSACLSLVASNRYHQSLEMFAFGRVWFIICHAAIKGAELLDHSLIKSSEVIWCDPNPSNRIY